MEEWAPENIPDYSRPFLTTYTIKNTLISNAFIHNLQNLPIYYIIDHIKSSELKRDKLSFYNFLLGKSFSHLSQIKEMDIKYTIFKYYFLSPSELTDIIFIVSSHFQDNTKTEPFLIDLSYIIINTKLFLYSLRNSNPDYNFLKMLLNKINISLYVLLNKDAKLTMYILKNIFDPNGVDIYDLFNNYLKSFEEFRGLPTLNETDIRTFQNIENPDFGVELLRSLASSPITGGKKTQKLRENQYRKCLKQQNRNSTRKKTYGKN
jgi:hypothetical protein